MPIPLIDFLRVTGSLEGRGDIRWLTGKDFKIGSPVVNKKLDVPGDKTEDVSKLTNKRIKIVPPRTNLRNWDLQTSTRSSLTSSKDNTSTFRNALKPVPIVSRREERISKFSSTKSLSVTDLRKNFEEIAKTVAEVPKYSTKKLDLFPKVTKSVASSPDAQSDKNVVPKIKQISSVGNESVCKVEETHKKTCKVILKPNVVGENVGITITGGTDENKDIIVHRIRYGSVAYQDGTLTKGDHIVSINGKDTKGLSYTDAVQLLKVRMS
ncbi:pro-interleukin-16-like [Harmonia axyridis]|uniref:pro-interleukin-16-like n=1 Tax=Harmonia axyridis TaxID=115357 RepID=UPI001E278260|nr:pro-interleukin-16-like [Harmonia axyridis]